jgi:hypothetical protein
MSQNSKNGFLWCNRVINMLVAVWLDSPHHTPLTGKDSSSGNLIKATSLFL